MLPVPIRAVAGKQRPAADIHIQIVYIAPVALGHDAEGRSGPDGDRKGTAHVEPVEAGQGVGLLITLVGANVFPDASSQPHDEDEKATDLVTKTAFHTPDF